MEPKERRTTLCLASIYAFRMLGLFMILPIFSLYIHEIRYATPFLIGFALGIYGLTQAILQIPFGMCSDRIGRKPVILAGLILFIIGSIVAALSHSIYGIILGRALQGAGAIGSTLTAFVADTTQEQNRLKAMAMIGMTIGLSFIIAMILGPALNNWVGLSGIFWLTAVLALLGIVIILFVVPTPKAHLHHSDSEPVLSLFSKILTNKELLRLDFGIFALHAMLTAVFLAIPLTLTHEAGLAPDHQWFIYLPVLLLAFVAMVPFIIIAEAKRKMKTVFTGAIAVLALVSLLLWLFSSHVVALAVLLFFFFTAFTLLEASLPSLIAKIAPAGSKGTAMGVYSSSQFLGIFVGGTLGGYLFHHFGLTSAYPFCLILGALWFVIAITMKKPKHLSSQILAVGKIDETTVNALRDKLLATTGVYDVMIAIDEQVAYLKVDKKELPERVLPLYNVENIA